MIFHKTQPNQTKKLSSEYLISVDFVWFGIFSNDISTFLGYLLPNASFYKKGSDSIIHIA